jgi:Raf kinase inhibitor-like YbhB/YbcL family protein
MVLNRNFQRALLAALIAAGCAGLAQSAAAEPFTLTSASFKDGTMLAVKNAGNNKSNPNCIGENISPPLSWSNVPAGTKSLALLMVDPEGRGGLGVNHWIAYGISPSIGGFAENEVSQMGSKFVGGKGTAGLGHYTGPCTPPGTGMHHYTFTLIATDLEPGELPPGLTHDELMAKLAGHAKVAAGLVGLFGRP